MNFESPIFRAEIPWIGVFFVILWVIVGWIENQKKAQKKWEEDLKAKRREEEKSYSHSQRPSPETVSPDPLLKIPHDQEEIDFHPENIFLPEIKLPPHETPVAINTENASTTSEHQSTENLEAFSEEHVAGESAGPGLLDTIKEQEMALFRQEPKVASSQISFLGKKKDLVQLVIASEILAKPVSLRRTKI